MTKWHHVANCTASLDGSTVTAKRPRHFTEYAVALGEELTGGRHTFRITFSGTGRAKAYVGVAATDAAIEPLAPVLPPGYDGQGVMLGGDGVATFGWLPKNIEDAGWQWDGLEGPEENGATQVSEIAGARGAWGLNMGDGAFYYTADARCAGWSMHAVTTPSSETVTMTIDVDRRSIEFSFVGTECIDTGVLISPAVRPWVLLACEGDSASISSQPALEYSGRKALPSPSVDGDCADRWRDLMRNTRPVHAPLLPERGSTSGFSVSLPTELRDDVFAMFSEDASRRVDAALSRDAPSLLTANEPPEQALEKPAGGWRFRPWTELRQDVEMVSTMEGARTDNTTRAPIESRVRSEPKKRPRSAAKASVP